MYFTIFRQKSKSCFPIPWKFRRFPGYEAFKEWELKILIIQEEYYEVTNGMVYADDVYDKLIFDRKAEGGLVEPDVPHTLTWNSGLR